MSESDVTGKDAFAVLQLLALLLSLVATAFVLPALSRKYHKSHKSRNINAATSTTVNPASSQKADAAAAAAARHALFLSVVFSDAVFSAIGVVHHIALVGQRGHKRLTQSLGGVVLDAVFQLAFVATLLWPSLLAWFALRDGHATRRRFVVRIHWQCTWVAAGVYGALWTRALQKGATTTNTEWDVLRIVLSALLGVSFLSVLGVASMLCTRKYALFPRLCRPRAIQEEPLIKYLVLVTLLQLLFAVTTWMGPKKLPHSVKELALLVVYLIPALNAYNYGSQATREMLQDKRSRTRTRTGGATHTSVTEDLMASMDPEIVALEELDGLSDMTFLAEGASGTVFKARWLGIDVAMKLIKLPNAGDNHDLYQTIIQNSEHAFLEEASICARLRHPNITLFIRAGHYEGKLGILTEFCQRGSLKDVLKKHFPLAWKRKVALALHVATGLTYLHARNPTYIHRDLKASNILVTDTWQAKLADFGISKVSNFVRKRRGGGGGGGAGGDALSSTRSGMGTESECDEYDGGGYGDGDGSFDPATLTVRTLNESTSFAGTWRWNAPEILQDPTNCRYSRKTDMYSFGMVLWEILSDGAVPFSDVRFDFEVRERVVAEMRPQIRPSMGCPDAFINLILQCWAQSPSARPSAPQAAAQLTQILESLSKSSASSGHNNRQPLESIDSGSDPSSSVFSRNTDRSARSTFGFRFTSFFRGNGNGNGNGNNRLTSSSSQQSSSRGGGGGFGSSRGFGGLGSSRGFFFRSNGPSHGSQATMSDLSDYDDPTNKFAMLGSPGRSTTSSSSSGVSYYNNPNGNNGNGNGSRRRGFSRESALPSLYEYDPDAMSSDASTVATTGVNDAGMSPIVELPMDAMLEDGGNHTFMEQHKPTRERDSERVESMDAAAAASSSVDSYYLTDDQQSRERGFTFDSVRARASGDSIVSATPMDVEYDELARTQPIKVPKRKNFPLSSRGTSSSTSDQDASRSTRTSQPQRDTSTTSGFV